MTGPAVRVACHATGTREVFHAVADQPLKVGWVIRPAGAPLCGALVRLGDCPPGLFPPAVTCRACLAVAHNEGIRIEAAS